MSSVNTETGSDRAVRPAVKHLMMEDVFFCVRQTGGGLCGEAPSNLPVHAGLNGADSVAFLSTDDAVMGGRT